MLPRFLASSLRITLQLEHIFLAGRPQEKSTASFLPYSYLLTSFLTQESTGPIAKRKLPGCTSHSCFCFQKQDHLCLNKTKQNKKAKLNFLLQSLYTKYFLFSILEKNAINLVYNMLAQKGIKEENKCINKNVYVAKEAFRLPCRRTLGAGHTEFPYEHQRSQMPKLWNCGPQIFTPYS